MAIKTQKKVDPFSGPPQRFAAGVLGMWVFLVVIAMMFFGAIIGYLVIRMSPDLAEPFIPEGAEGLPNILIFSTIALMASGFTMHRATQRVRQGQPGQAHRAMSWTLLLAVAFLVLQSAAWISLYQHNVRPGENLYAWSFYVLTGLHAVHVMAGFVPLIRVWRKTAHGHYSKAHPEGIVYCEMYWHLLGGIWLVLYFTLWLGMRT
ncbi:MAG: cytochrome c oxidase subunit 3 [Planctomycetes bacterium]|nr:cytochrome c oxidase subunit 3 [Planctomycetota bacterium]